MYIYIYVHYNIDITIYTYIYSITMYIYIYIRYNCIYIYLHVYTYVYPYDVLNRSPIIFLVELWVKALLANFSEIRCEIHGDAGHGKPFECSLHLGPMQMRSGDGRHEFDRVFLIWTWGDSPIYGIFFFELW